MRRKFMQENIHEYSKELVILLKCIKMEKEIGQNIKGWTISFIFDKLLKNPFPLLVNVSLLKIQVFTHSR